MVNYDKDYYDHYCGDQPYGYHEPWLSFFRHVAQQIRLRFEPKLVLDVGCAMGILVHQLHEEGVRAFGFDSSAYAIEQAPWYIKPFVKQYDLTRGAGPYLRFADVVCCIEVLEHIAEDYAMPCVAALCSMSRQWIAFSSSPDDHENPTHLNVQPREYWIKLFKLNGYLFAADAHYIAGHAMVFVRSL